MICKLSYRKVFSFLRGTPFTSLYRLGYDNKSLVNPPLIDGWRTVPKIISKIFLPLIKQTGYFKINNHLCSFDTRNTQYHSLYFERFVKNGYEPEVMALLDILFSHGGVFYDIGANWGYFTGYVASIPEFDGKIYAFEPQKSIFNDLNILIKEAHLRNVFPINMALSDTVIQNACMKSVDNFHSGLARLQEKRIGNVGVNKIDNLSFKHPTVMKIDAEGHEFKIMKGGIRTITKNKPYIIFENPRKELADIFLFSKSIGYYLYNLQVLAIKNNIVELEITEIKSEENFSSRNIFACPSGKNHDFELKINSKQN